MSSPIANTNDKKRPALEQGSSTSTSSSLAAAAAAEAPKKVTVTVMVPRQVKPPEREDRSHRPVDDRERNRWPSVPTYNARLDCYYRAVLDMPELEHLRFLETLKASLPACFHMNPDFPFTKDLQNQVTSLCGNLSVYLTDSSNASATTTNTTTTTGLLEDPDPIKLLKWYPHGCGYQFGMDRRTIRKHPALEKLHEWLKEHTNNGNITRQEAVSMVPPLALHVSPHHKCLDMCAAPGSKTSQLLEIVNRSVTTNKMRDEVACTCNVCAQEVALNSSSPVTSKTGLVVANDADTERAYMLVHQCKRINSPLLLISTHKGQNFPPIVDPQVKDEMAGFFDRVLCDVPCSGDGTLRKNPEIWGKWNTGGSFSLHPLQLQIANRGIELLRQGGLIVYSTCSMSPYEDEAVVAELLRTHRGKIELVDSREYLPLFKCRRGLSSWPVIDDAPSIKEERNGDSCKRARKTGPLADDLTGSEQTINSSNSNSAAAGEVVDSEPNEGLRRCLAMGMAHYKSFEDVPESVNKKVRKSMFPPSAEEADWMHLDRCMRCLPHDEDSGGFFVATFRKIVTPSLSAATLSSTSSSAASNDMVVSSSAAAAATTANEPEPDHKRSTQKGYVEYLPIPKDNFEQMRAFYGLSAHLRREDFWFREDFSRDKNDNANKHTRKNNNQAKGGGGGGGGGGGFEGEIKPIFYLPSSVQSMLFGDVQNRLKLVSAGVKAFERRSDSKGNVDFRVVQDCIPYIGPYIGERRVVVTVQDICNMLEGGLVSFTTLHPTTLQFIQQQSVGSIVCTYTFDPKDVVPKPSTEEEEDALMKQFGSYSFHVICWRGPTKTLNVIGSKIDFTSVKEQLVALKVYKQKVSAKSLNAAATTAAAATAVVATSSEVVNNMEEGGQEHHEHEHHEHDHHEHEHNGDGSCCGGAVADSSSHMHVHGHDHSESTN